MKAFVIPRNEGSPSNSRGCFLRQHDTPAIVTDHFPPRRFNSSFIKESSRPVWPLTLLFSWARRIRYGITSLIGPNGKYLLTEKPALARLNVIWSLMPYSCEKWKCG